MSKLTELLPDLAQDENYIEIVGIHIPIKFNMMTLSYIEDAYGKPFGEMEAKLKEYDGDSNSLNADMVKLMSAMLYGVVRTGGTETTVDELMSAFPSLDETISAFDKVSVLFEKSYFQTEDTNKLKDGEDSKK